ncbi:MAG: ABC transporter permease [Desulfosarcina sp.]|nr:ABC transporter permease [Desulfosarcina sp.]MBC2764941.1 ABC transporter permease [Desulfosarcina sp.]
MGWRNVWRNPRRSLLTMGAISFACVLLIFMLSMQFGSYETMINASLRIRTGHLQIQAAGYHKKQRMRDTVDHPSEINAILDDISGIRATTMRANGFALVSSTDRSVGILISGVDPQKEPQVTTIVDLIRSGSWFSGDTTFEAVIGNLLARSLKVSVGDELTLLGQGRDGSIAAGMVTVKGIFSSGMDEMDRLTLVIPLKVFQALFAMEESVHEIVVNAALLNETEQIQKKIQGRLPPPAAGKALTVLNWKTLNPGLMDSIAMDLSMGIIMYGVLIIVVAFSILNTFLMVIFERTREFGLLMALGTTPGRLIRLVLSESILITLMGVASGVLCGTLLTGYFQIHGIDLTGQSDLLSQYGISGMIYPRLSVLSVSAGPMTVLLITFLAALFPALKVTRLKPVAAIAHH